MRLRKEDKTGLCQMPCEIEEIPNRAGPCMVGFGPCPLWSNTPRPTYIFMFIMHGSGCYSNVVLPEESNYGNPVVCTAAAQYCPPTSRQSAFDQSTRLLLLLLVRLGKPWCKQGHCGGKLHMVRPVLRTKQTRIIYSPGLPTINGTAGPF